MQADVAHLPGQVILVGAVGGHPARAFQGVLVCLDGFSAIHLIDGLAQADALVEDATSNVNWDAYRLMKKRFEARLKEIEWLSDEPL